MAALWLAFFSTGAAQETASAEDAGAEKARQFYETSKKAFQTSPKDIESGIALARACFDWAEYAQTKDQRERLAEEGIAACRAILEKLPDHFEAHYYLGKNLGQLARARKWSALPLVGEMEEAFLKAAHGKPGLQEGGPHRYLGKLYAQAPGWPISVGNRKKARKHFEKAIETAPLYPGNRLDLAQFLLEWKEREALAALLKDLDGVWDKAMNQYQGAEWKNHRRKWRQKRERFKTKAREWGYDFPPEPAGQTRQD